MYYDMIYNVRYYLPILTFIFFTILLFDKKSRFSAFVVFMVCIIFYLMPDLNENQQPAEYIKDFLAANDITIAFNVAAMLSLLYRKDKVSRKHTFIFACIIFLHVVVSLKVINGFYWWNYHLVTFYNEILIALALYQIWVSKDGMVRTYRRIQVFNSRYWLSTYVHLQRSPRPQRREKKT